jgi:hypothetical protein
MFEPDKLIHGIQPASVFAFEIPPCRFPAVIIFFIPDHITKLPVQTSATIPPHCLNPESQDNRIDHDFCRPLTGLLKPGSIENHRKETITGYLYRAECSFHILLEITQRRIDPNRANAPISEGMRYTDERRRKSSNPTPLFSAMISNRYFAT